jgi:hypothetical protein
MTFDEKREELAAAHRLIRAGYDAGTPFFTKELFRDFVRQLESNTDDRISVIGLDRFAVHFPIETGNVYRSHPYGDEFACFMYECHDFSLSAATIPTCRCPLTLFLLVFPNELLTSAKPRLQYRTIQDLLTEQDPNCYSVCRAYLPVEVVHATEVRNAHTNEVANLWPTADYATTKLKLEQMKRSLEASDCFALIKSTLTSSGVSPSIEKVVALGWSTIPLPKDDDVMSSMVQHTLALAIRDLLANLYPENARSIHCYAQDPFYTPVDEQVLSEAGFTLVDDPRAFLDVDEASVVITMNPDIPVRQIVADIARPAMMIWNKVAVSDPDRRVQVPVLGRSRALTAASSDPVSSRVIQMMKEYIEVPFPAQNDHFGDIAIYVRRQDTMEEGPTAVCEQVPEMKRTFNQCGASSRFRLPVCFHEER